MLVSRGNSKPCIGRDTLILNITSAWDCESQKLGLCKIPVHKCYARRCEIFRPNVLAYRRKQTTQWDGMSPDELTAGILAKAKRIRSGPSIKYLRISESGDLRNQADVFKLSRIAHALGRKGIKTYVYTARSDLDFSRVSRYLTVNGSGFMVHNEYRAVKGLPAKETVCPNKAKCKLCKVRGGVTVLTKLR